ncbi:carbohydrate ABC transporter permease [Cohnella sp. REN36]|uniref:carbohydrate ABC transporter permease n=1 Tax=Cohnella sp. REN36 TaxID=2887347 RepID=UPI001D135D5C|nr:sugar ABC transporter permease [Cohnella sp. REN36]MCC3373568.1 sugar ABC transporter permease [Cohnella sp. REN36]
MSFLAKRPFLLFLLPGFIIYSLFVVYPIVAAASISFFRWNGIGPKTFVGLDNYIELFTSSEMMSQFSNALLNSLRIFVLTVLILIPLQIIAAYLIYNQVKGYKFFRVAVFSPQFISTPVIVFIFMLLLDSNVGVFNKLLEWIGLGEYVRPWLGLPGYGMNIVWLMMSWSGFGVGMIFFLGAMKMISKESLEAGYLDGAGFWKRLFSIILPQMKITILNMILITYIVSMTVFDFNYILGGVSGGVDHDVDVMALLFYRIAFGESRNPLGGNISENSMGLGSTVACVLFLLIFVMSMLQVWLTYRRREEV